MSKMTPEEYYYHSVDQAQRNLERRQEAWEMPECQKIYNSLLEIAGADNIKPGKKGKAKELAITHYLNNTEPDYEAFAEEVYRANNAKWGRKK